MEIASRFLQRPAFKTMYRALGKYSEGVLRNPIRMTALALLTITFALLLAQPSFAQQRMSDRDIETLMKNLKQDGKKFQSSFDSSISKSAVRKTSQEKIYKDLVKSFNAQVDTMLDVFQSKHKADTTLPGVLTAAHQIDDVFLDYQIPGNAKADWNSCKAILVKLAAEFNMPLNQ
jgi:hypothetical protein